MTANSTNLPATNGADAGPMPTAWSAESFAAVCRRIVSEMRGHAAHRELDLLTNQVLSRLGYSEGIAIFEAAVARWHAQPHQYPYFGPCPDCEARHQEKNP